MTGVNSANTCLQLRWCQYCLVDLDNILDQQLDQWLSFASLKPQKWTILSTEMHALYRLLFTPSGSGGFAPLPVMTNPCSNIKLSSLLELNETHEHILSAQAHVRCTRAHLSTLSDGLGRQHAYRHCIVDMQSMHAQ